VPPTGQTGDADTIEGPFLFGQILKGIYGHIKPKYRNDLQYIIIMEKIKQTHSFPQLIIHEYY
jgi:hypothetical protein